MADRRRRASASRRWRRPLLPAALTRGQRPYALALAALLLVIALVAATPAQRYLEQRDRVAELEAERAQLAEEVADLEERREELEDPDEIELLARDLGLVRPGEIPYVVRRDDDAPRALASEREPDEEAREDDAPWWRTLGEALGLLGDDRDTAPDDEDP